MNVNFAIDYLNYDHPDNDSDNHESYHGGSDMSEKKPGAEYVDDIYGGKRKILKTSTLRG